MLTLTAGKKAAMDRLSTQEGIISALAIDQRGALKKMIKALDVEPTDAQIETFKELVSKELTPYASAILLIQNMDCLLQKHAIPRLDCYSLMKKRAMMQQLRDDCLIY